MSGNPEQGRGIYSRELADRFGEAIDLGGEVEEIAFLRDVLARRTHRAYAPKPVPEPLLRLLTATALSASSKSDFQQATIIRVIDPEKRAALAALIPAMPWIGAAPVFLVFCGDARRLERIGQLRDHPETNGRLEGFFDAAVDAALVMQTFILAAEAAKLGCCPSASFATMPTARARSWACRIWSFPWPASASAIPRRPAISASACRRRSRFTPIATMMPPCPSGSMAMIARATPATRFRARSSATRRSSVMLHSTAGPRTRRDKPPRPRARPFRLIFADTASPSIEAPGSLLSRPAGRTRRDAIERNLPKQISTSRVPYCTAGSCV